MHAAPRKVRLPGVVNTLFQGVNVCYRSLLCMYGQAEPGWIGVNRREDIERVFRENGPDIWRAVYVYAGKRREIADDAVAEAFA